VQRNEPKKARPTLQAFGFPLASGQKPVVTGTRLRLKQPSRLIGFWPDARAAAEGGMSWRYQPAAVQLKRESLLHLASENLTTSRVEKIETAPLE